jgi:hypothetical protein
MTVSKHIDMKKHSPTNLFKEAAIHRIVIITRSTTVALRFTNSFDP